MPDSLTPDALRHLLEQEPDEIFLLDVREPAEYRIAHLPGSILIPLSTLPARLTELPMDRRIVVYCHHGVRSGQAAGWLAHQGFTNVYNLAGGIDAWSQLVDPSIPRY